MTDRYPNGVIYKFQNKITSKVYIGKTIDVKTRYRRHKWLVNNNKGYAIHDAMRKYGFEGFDFEVICCALKEPYIKELEALFIKEYDSFTNGYNLTLGGEGNVGHKHSPESLAKMKACKSGENNPMFGRTISNEHRERLSIVKSGKNHPMFGKTHTKEAIDKLRRSGAEHPMFGRKHSEESIKKMSESRKAGFLKKKLKLDSLV